MADFTEAFAGLEDQYGLPRGYLLRSAQIESSLNPNSQSKLSSAGGLFQFIDSTARQYGLKNKYDPYESSNAAARLGSDNASKLRTALGRDPTAAELYLAHQQGGGGAAGLLANPSAPAASIVGRDAVTNNGGNLNMTAGEFANLWLNKFDKGAASAKSTGNTPMPSAMPRIMGGQGQETQLPPILQGQQQGGLAGLFNDPTKMAYMAMIAKGLNPWSDLNPQEMLAQAQRQQLAQSQMFYERQKDARDFALRKEQFGVQQQNVEGDNRRADERLRFEREQATVTPAMRAAKDIGITDPKDPRYQDFMRNFYQLKGEGWTAVEITQNGEKTTVFKNPRGEFKRPEELIPGFSAGTPNNPYAVSGKMNTDEAKSANYADRMATAHKQITDLEKINNDVPGYIAGVAGNMTLPVVGAVKDTAAFNSVSSPDRQRLYQAQRNFVNAILRKESGAAVSQTEFDNAAKQYFPQPGDKPEAIEQKRLNRLEATQGLMREAGRNYKPPKDFMDATKPSDGWTEIDGVKIRKKQ